MPRETREAREARELRETRERSAALQQHRERCQALIALWKDRYPASAEDHGHVNCAEVVIEHRLGYRRSLSRRGIFWPDVDERAVIRKQVAEILRLFDEDES